MNVPSTTAAAVASAPMSSEFVSASLQPLDLERVQPVVEREALPREVEAALGVVEREEDHDRDRDEQVDQRARPTRRRAATSAAVAVLI